MPIEEFLNKCTPDCRDILKIFIIFMNNIVNGKNLDYEFLVLDNDNNPCVASGGDITIFYLIYTIFYTKSDLAEMLKQNGADIEKYFRINPKVNKELELIISGFKNVTMTDLDLCFEEKSWARTILDTFTGDIEADWICLERIFINLTEIINRIPNLKEALQNNENLGQIEALAKSKENIRTLSVEATPVPPAETKNTLKNQDYKGPSVIKDKGLGCGVELTMKHFEYNPLIGREKELRTLGALLMDEEKSVVIHGLPGVGKTTIVNGLAYQIQKGLINDCLRNKRIYEVSASELISGTRFRGEFEERLLDIIKKLISKENSILFIDEFHSLMGLGSTTEDRNNDAANILKPYLSDGRLKIIGGTTTNEYKILKSDMAFDRRFIGLEIPELAMEKLMIILNTVIERYNKRKSIGFCYSQEIRSEFLKVLIGLSKEEYQNPVKKLYNPDLSLTILRFCYDFAMYDGKKNLDLESLIEGVDFAKSAEYINDDGNKYFQEKILKLTKK